MRKPDTALRKRLDDHSIWVETDGKHGELLMDHDEFENMDLHGEDLRWADLCYCDFTGADLSEAKLLNADLSEGFLVNTNLRYADLRCANLRKTDMRGCDLRFAITDNVLLPATDRLLDLQGWQPHVQRDWIRIGCQYHRTDEWANFTDAQISVMHYRALEWWREHRDLILETARECEPYT